MMFVFPRRREEADREDGVSEDRDTRRGGIRLRQGAFYRFPREEDQYGWESHPSPFIESMLEIYRAVDRLYQLKEGAMFEVRKEFWEERPKEETSLKKRRKKDPIGVIMESKSPQSKKSLSQLDNTMVEYIIYNHWFHEMMKHLPEGDPLRRHALSIRFSTRVTTSIAFEFYENIRRLDVRHYGKTHSILLSPSPRYFPINRDTFQEVEMKLIRSFRGASMGKRTLLYVPDAEIGSITEESIPFIATASYIPSLHGRMVFICFDSNGNTMVGVLRRRVLDKVFRTTDMDYEEETEERVIYTSRIYMVTPTKGMTMQEFYARLISRILTVMEPDAIGMERLIDRSYTKWGIQEYNVEELQTQERRGIRLFREQMESAAYIFGIPFICSDRTGFRTICSRCGKQVAGNHFRDPMFKCFRCKDIEEVKRVYNTLNGLAFHTLFPDKPYRKYDDWFFKEEENPIEHLSIDQFGETLFRG